MTFPAKLASPLPSWQAYPDYLIHRIATDPVTIFCAPSGYVSTSSLATTLNEQTLDAIWCRLDPIDSDPGMLLTTLVDGLRQQAPDAGSDTLESMREHPGPVSGWPLLFASLAQETGEIMTRPCVLVLEQIQNLTYNKEVLQLLTTHFIPLLPAHVHCILISNTALPKKELPARATTLGPLELRQDAITLYDPHDPSAMQLPRHNLQRLVTLMQGKPEAIASALSAGEWLGFAALQAHIQHANNQESLLERIARDCLVGAQPAEIEALAVCLHLEYDHPDLIRLVLEGVNPPDGPWWQTLKGGWRRILRFWQAPLRQALRSAATAPAEALMRAAEYYTGQYAAERAVALYLELGKPVQAAQCMNAAAGAMINLGQWQTLQTWLARLPAAVLNRWPRLVYAGIEIMVARGDIVSARRAFASATRLFEDQQDLVGVCQSLLAESALALNEQDLETARERARLALDRARQGEFPWFIVWAAWHLGCLFLVESDLEQALDSFTQARQAAETLSDSASIALTLQVEALVRQQRNLALERERHRRTYFMLEQNERETANRLRFLLMEVPSNLDALLRVHGWSNMPLSIKMQPALPPGPQVSEEKPRSNPIWERLRKLLIGSAPEASLEPREIPPLPAAPAAQTGPFRPAAAGQRTMPGPAMSQSVPELKQATPAPVLEEPKPDQAAHALTVHLLGAFQARVNGHPIENLPRGQVLMLFQFLLVHRERSTPREVLMETFWPNVTPESARNSLNVALYNLRKAVAGIDEEQLVLFQSGGYQINPAFECWLDFEEFEQLYRAGKKARIDGNIETEASSYEACVSLYQGDFLEDEPYEDWPVLTRERLRLAYLEALDRSSQISYTRKQYSASIELCQRLLIADDCREDAHCRLMRCYVQQGQYHLAIRQYQTCVETLERELGVDPAPSTRELYERILKREPFP